MKTKRILSLLLAAVLAFGLIAGAVMPAFAYYSVSVEGKVGTSMKVKVYDSATTHREVNIGSITGCPSWLSFKLVDGSIFASGTPTEPDSFTVTVALSEYDGESTTDNELRVAVKIVGSTTNLTTINEILSKGKAFSKEYNTVSTGGSISDVSVSGSLPKGLTYTAYNSWVTISGTPTESGTFNVSLKAWDTASETWRVQPLKFVIGTSLTITKSPTNETTDENGPALFISAAEGYSKLEWRVVSKDGKTVYAGEDEIKKQFTGVDYNAYKGSDGREYLRLTNIPLTMDGYYVETKFWGADNPEETATTKTGNALLTVLEAKLASPTVITHPTSTSAEVGKPVYLTVGAETKTGALRFQWYSNSSNSNSNGKKIDGAVSNRYTPPQTAGTIYYYCEIRAADGDTLSDAVYTRAAAVSYTEPTPAEPEPPEEPVETPEPEPPEQPAETPEPEAPAADPDPKPAEPADTPAHTAPVPEPEPNTNTTPNTNKEPHKKSGNSLIVTLLLIVMILIALVSIALVGFLIWRKKKMAEDYDDYSDYDL